MKLLHVIAGLGSLLVLLGARPAVAQVTLTNTGIKIIGQNDGSVEIYDSAGVERAYVSGYRIKTPVAIAPSGGAPSLVTLSDGTKAVQMNYTLTGDTFGTTKIVGLFTTTPYRVHVKFTLTGDASLDPSTAMMLRRVISPTVAQAVEKLGLWTRNDNGGEPVEVKDMNLFSYGFSAMNLYLYTPGANMGWNDTSSTHLPGVASGAGTWIAEADFAVVNARSVAGSALINARSVALDIWTAQPFNVWTTSSSGLVVSAQAINTGSATKTCTLSWWGRDFNGTVLTQGSATSSLTAGQAWNRSITFAGPTRGLVFVEVSVTDGTTTAFERTNLSVLPAYTFSSGSESIFGLSATFEKPTTADELNLVKRMGVRYLRQATYTTTEASSIGASQYYHGGMDWTSGAATQDWIDGMYTDAAAYGSAYWELSNEMNLSSGAAAQYVTNELIPVKNRGTALGSSVKIMLGGVAGMDSSWINEFVTAGGWPYIDAFALHPGRGNFTADYPGEFNDVSSPNPWTFLGAVRKSNGLLVRYGTRPFYLTETYACTRPHNYWVDTSRHAAENVLLQYALAMEEKVKIMFFYQFNNGVWSDVGGVNPDNNEYHFGLLNRDLSLKPSAHAYCTIAEALDKATFVRWLFSTDTNFHGMLFSTPRGNMAIVWTRHDSMVLSSNTSTYSSPEAWVNPWWTRTDTTIPTATTSIKVIDCIGQSSTVTASSGSATVTLDGAPRIIYGVTSTFGSAIVVDNSDSSKVTQTGTWTASSSAPGYAGWDYLHDGNANKGSMSIKYTPTITTAGTYKVYARWPQGGSRATNVPYKVVYSGGSATVTMNQTVNYSKWMLLGTYTFTAGTSGSVTVSNSGTSGYVTTDAIAFVPQ